MVKVNSRFHHIAWEFLLTCIHIKVNGGRITDSERRIIVASPWINDLGHRSLRINSPLLEGVETTTRRNLSSLGKVLETLSQLNFEVFVVTSAPGSRKWKSGWNEMQIERDRRFQNRLKSSGIYIIHNENSHAKSVSTPVGVLDGSANLTDNGFFRNIEHMEVTSGSHSDFAQARHVVNQLVD